MAATFWRKDNPVIHEGRVTMGGMFPYQRKLWNASTFYKALVAGYGSGKTFFGAKRALSLALYNAPVPFGVVSPTHRIAKRTVVPTLLELLRGKQTLEPSLTYRYNKADGEIIVNHRQRKATLWLNSGEDPEALKGPNLCGAWIDEPFVQDKEVFEQMDARVRAPQARMLEILMTGTPEELNWGYDITEGEDADNYDMTVVHASSRDNLALPPNFVERLLKAYDPKMVQAFIDGAFVSLSKGLVYHAFSEENIVRLEDPGVELEVGMDFNVDPMAAVVFWRKGPHLHYMAEIELPNADTEYMCQYLKDKYTWGEGPLEGSCRVSAVYPDASGKARSTNAPGGMSDFHYIKEAGFELYSPKANPKIRDRENALNGKFSPADGSRPTVTVDPRCKKLISYFRQYSHDKRNKPSQKKMSHLLDAAGYPVAYLYPVYKPASKIVRLVGH